MKTLSIQMPVWLYILIGGIIVANLLLIGFIVGLVMGIKYEMELERTPIMCEFPEEREQAQEVYLA